MAKSALQLEIQGLKELQRGTMMIIKDLHGDEIFDAMRDSTLKIQRRVMKGPAGGRGAPGSTPSGYIPVDTGRLRASISPIVQAYGPVVRGIVGTNVEYACIFGAHTRITTKGGGKTIGQIRTGDMVLAQDGEYRRVIATHSFPAAEKPNLVDIEARWRSDRCHRLTVTADHKMLAYRDGRFMWILAGELKSTDCLVMRRKINKGIRTNRPRQCLNCGQDYYPQGALQKKRRRYCSQACKTAHYANGHNPHIGMKRSLAARLRMSAAARTKLAAHPNLHPNRILAQRGYRTGVEKQVQAWLDNRPIAYERQKRIGRHYVDFYLPTAKIIIEADGSYWHKDQAKDIERDKAILATLPGSRIYHIHFFDKRHSPQLRTSPIPDAFYIAVNPGMKSYVDPEQFCQTKILKLRPWVYEQRGDKPARLYDLTVEGMHSFFANGLLVSNSYHEFGTRRGIRALKYMRASLEETRQWIYDRFDRAMKRIVKRKPR